jgi:hypothetical protein
MSRKRATQEAAQEPARETPDIFDEQIAAQAAQPELVGGAVTEGAGRTAESAAQPVERGARTEQKADKRAAWQPRPVITEVLSDGSKMKMYDGYGQGVSVTIENSDPSEKPSANVLEPLKEQHEGRNTPRYKNKHWHKEVRNNPVGERLDMEGRMAESVKRRKEEIEGQSR